MATVGAARVWEWQGGSAEVGASGGAGGVGEARAESTKSGMGAATESEETGDEAGCWTLEGNGSVRVLKEERCHTPLVERSGSSGGAPFADALAAFNVWIGTIPEGRKHLLSDVSGLMQTELA